MKNPFKKVSNKVESAKPVLKTQKNQDKFSEFRVEQKGNKMYDIIILPFDREDLISDLRGSGKVIDTISINTETADDKINEVIFAVKKDPILVSKKKR